MRFFNFNMIVMFLLINMTTLIAETTNHQWIYDKNGDCAVYDDFGFEKNLEVFWSGTCRDKKAQGHGIAIVSSENNNTRSNLFRFEGNIKNGKYNGQAYLKWYKTGDKGSFNFADSVMEGEANIMTNNGEVFLNGNYANGKFTLKKKAVMSTSSEEEYDAFRKTRKPAYKYGPLLREKLIKPCEYYEHTLRARKYDGRRLSAPAFRSLITCYSENEKYKEALNLYNESLKYPKADNKFFIKLLHRHLAFSYHGVGKYEKSFKHLEKLSNSTVTKETLVLLESKHFMPFDNKRKNF